MSNMFFNDNEECALALFNYLVSNGKAKASDAYIHEEILHDLNNLRGREWLGSIERNLSTKGFFDYIGAVDFLEDEFVYGCAIEPNLFLKIALNEDFPRNVTFDDVRDALDEKGLQELWDFPVDDLDEAINNLSDDMWLVAVGFYVEDGYFARVFEITDEMAERFNAMLDENFNLPRMAPENEISVTEQEMNEMAEQARVRMQKEGKKVMSKLDAQISSASEKAGRGSNTEVKEPVVSSPER